MFLEKPHSKVDDHPLLSDLLDHQSSFSKTLVSSVATTVKSISTDSTIVSLSSANIRLPSSTDISHPLISVSSSTDTLNSNYPLTITITPSTGIHYPLIDLHTTSTQSQMAHLTEPSTTSVDDQVIVETLLGLREGSVITESERLDWFQAKGERVLESLATSSSQEKGENESTPLAREGERCEGVSQGEPLMQEKRDFERKAGT